MKFIIVDSITEQKILKSDVYETYEKAEEDRIYHQPDYDNPLVVLPQALCHNTVNNER